jgi:hypothetical protein
MIADWPAPPSTAGVVQSAIRNLQSAMDAAINMGVGSGA